MGLEYFAGDAGTVVADSRYAPIFFATWFGVPDEAVIERFFDWNSKVIARARELGGYVLITDSTQAKRPTPTQRRLIARRTEQMPPDATALNLGNYVVLDNPLIRGALTAMQWLSAGPWAITSVATCRQAIERALDDLTVAGLQTLVPLDAQSYRPPPRHIDA